MGKAGDEALDLAASSPADVPLGARYVGLVRVFDRVHVTMAPAGWSFVTDDGRYAVPLDPAWDAGAGIAPFATLEELLATVR